MTFPTNFFATVKDNFATASSYCSRKVDELGTHLVDQYNEGCGYTKFGESTHERIGHIAQRAFTGISACYYLDKATNLLGQSLKALFKGYFGTSALCVVTSAAAFVLSHSLVSLTLNPIGYSQRLFQAVQHPSETLKKIFT